MKSVKSRYALCDVDISHFEELKLSGKTNISTSPNEPGIIWVPWTISQTGSIVMESEENRRYWKRFREIKKRIQKIENIRNKMK